ncbi:MAG: hypothetical protein ACXWWA_10925 [Chitinophagaceae bacterium]
MKNSKWVGIALVLIISGCTSSRITSTWKAENTVAQKYNKVMVLGLIRESDRTIQENMENHFVGDLKDLGYNVVSSMQEYGPKAFDKMDEEAAIGKLKNSGVDAVITIVLLNKEKERRYVPGHLNYSPYGYYYNRFWGYRTALYNRIYEPGYYVIDTKYFWESNLYDMVSQKLVYSVQTESFDEASSNALGHEYGRLIVKNMVKENVLQQQGKVPAKPF